MPVTYVVMRFDERGRPLPACDLLNSPAHALVTPVSCVGKMGKGLALRFREQYPAMFALYAQRCGAKLLLPGQIWPYVAEGRLILNAATKAHWRDPSQLRWIEGILRELLCKSGQWGIRSLAMPALGCGNGGLRWDQVGPVLRASLDRLPFETSVYIHEGDRQY